MRRLGGNCATYHSEANHTTYDNDALQANCKERAQVSNCCRVWTTGVTVSQRKRSKKYQNVKLNGTHIADNLDVKIANFYSKDAMNSDIYSISRENTPVLAFTRSINCWSTIAVGSSPLPAASRIFCPSAEPISINPESKSYP